MELYLLAVNIKQWLSFLILDHLGLGFHHLGVRKHNVQGKLITTHTQHYTKKPLHMRILHMVKVKLKELFQLMQSLSQNLFYIKQEIAVY